MLLSLDMYQTVAVAVLVLLLGSFLKKRIYFLEKFCFLYTSATVEYNCGGVLS